MVIFRENSEDIYAGVEWQSGSDEAKKVIDFLVNEMGVTKIRFPDSSGIGIKPVSSEGTKRLVRKALQYDPGNKVAHRSLWRALMAAGRKAELLPALRAANHVMPDDELNMRLRAKRRKRNPSCDGLYCSH